jgi:hypothetical protein
MNPERLLSSGVGGWLMYEYCCNRSRIFNERYMAGPNAQVLNAKYGMPLYSEYVHPVLAKDKVDGRRPGVDFVVVEDGGSKLVLPRSETLRPNRDFLAERYERFCAA